MGAADLLRSRLLLLAIAIAVGIGALVGAQLLDSRAAVLEQAKAANTNLLVTVSHVIDTALEAADRSLQYSSTMATQLDRMARESGADAAEAHDFIRQADTNLFYPHVADDRYGIQLVLDDTGSIVASSRAVSKGGQNFSHRPYFQVHQQNRDAGLYIGTPFLSDYDNRASVALSRRWDHDDGSFGGVVVQTLKLSRLNDLFSTFELGPDSGISVFLSDGNVLAQFPYDNDAMIASAADSRWFERFRLQRQGSLTGIAGVASVDGLHVFRWLDKYPVLLTVTQASQNLLEPWAQNARRMALETLFLMAACIWLAVLAERRMAAQRLAATRLGRAERELQTIIENLPILISYWDDKLINRMANTAHRDWTGLEPEQMSGMHVSGWLDERQLRELQPRIDAALAGEPQIFEWETRDVSGALRHSIVSYIPDRQNGAIKGLFVTITDITERRVVEVALLDEKERFRVILESIKDGVVTTSREGNILYLNPAAAQMIGRDLADVRGKPVEQVMRLESPDGGADTSVLGKVLQSGQPLGDRVEQVLVGRRGQRIHIENWAAPILDKQGRMRAAVQVFHEIGQVRKMANRMAHLAQHDALTGLPNRRSLDLAGQRSLELARSQERKLAVLYVDLDGFKQVNDDHGHAVGDELLVAITRRLCRQLRSTDRLYRQGGDEFVVWGESVQSHEEAVKLSMRLIECCQTPVSCGSGQFSVTLSVGISLFPEDGTELAELVQRADRGMYAAKNAGRNRYARVGVTV